MAKKQKTKEALVPQGSIAEVSDGYFPIVGIGASAGGLSAFEAFFSGMPKESNPDISFVLVQHLAPDHKSILNEIIQRYTTMHVFEVEDGMKIERNCIYIIPPNYDMAILNGRLQLLEPTEARGRRLPIDFFFRSLAQDQHEKAIGIILSGTGSDGTQGVRAIKAEGGMIIAQKTESCEYDGMPRSAIATGLVDYELLPQEMPEKLIAYAKHVIKITSTISIKVPNDENALKKIFILLRSHTGHDFSNYKLSTINRRLERRMALHQIDSLERYVRYLQHEPDEIEGLFRELLIGVTKFFRDADVFESLKQIIPKLFASKQYGDPIRIWSTGCSTGEEAYSIAILMQEYMQELNEKFTVQIFATDIDSRAIATARAGVYPSDITADVSVRRLSQFFTPEEDGNKYRIDKVIRDMLIFSEQNVTKDPPFSRLDLISCRNLLIYMDSALQKRLIPLFHYALNPGGILLLGNSETIGEYGNLFDVLDNKSKIFQRKENEEGASRIAMDRLLSGPSSIHSTPHQIVQNKSVQEKLPLRELTQKALLESIAPTAALVNEYGDILYLYGKAGAYLELPSGEVGTNNILKMVRTGLEYGLTTALHNATTTKEIVKSAVLKVKINAQYKAVIITIKPIKSATQNTDLYLVVFEEVHLEEGEDERVEVSGKDAAIQDVDKRIETLTCELRTQEEFLKTANQKLQISNEELRSSNEEIQSMNEELQSTNEELETSKEELQSVNEELSTVNAELQTKVHDLSRSNNDMNNLLSGTGIGTIFVDHNLLILRFTPAATKIINLIQGDLGRPVGHIVSNLLGYNSLKEDIQLVLDTLIPKEMEVQSLDAKWFIMRIQPYRTLDNIIEGAVITFVEITENVRLREDLAKANRELLRLAVVVRDASDAITVQDLQGNILAWNPAASRLYGWSETEALQINTKDRIPKERKDEEFAKLVELDNLESIEPYCTKRLTKDGRVVNVQVILTALVNSEGKIYAVSTTEKAINTEYLRTKEADNGQ